MAEEVLHGLLGRVPCIRTAAALPNFVRYGVRGHVFPAILPLDGASTSGLLLDGLTDREVRWLDWFEDEYGRAGVSVLLEGDRSSPAQAYLWAGPAAALTMQPWDYEAFRQNDLEWYLDRTVRPCREDLLRGAADLSAP